MKLILLALLVVLTGCSHTREFARQRLDDGTKEEWVTVQETAVGILSPSIKRVYEFNKVTGERRPITGTIATGNGASGAALQAVGTWAGLKAVGDGLADSGDKTSFNGGNQTQGQTQEQLQHQSQTDIIGPQRPRDWPPGHYKSPKDRDR